MKRRKFFKSLAIGGTAAVVIPTVLAIPVKRVVPERYTFTKESIKVYPPPGYKVKVYGERILFQRTDRVKLFDAGEFHESLK